jgi:hypothetical protein
MHSNPSRTRRGEALRWVQTSIALLLLTVTAAPAQAEMWMEPAFPKEALKGPTEARGAFIWSHGNNGNEWEDEAAGGVPMVASLLRERGWDVFLFKRTFHEIGAPHPQAVELEAQVDRLKAKGYREIVLGGQSQGAWISIMAAGDRADIRAVIANAPATYGMNRPRSAMNASELYGLLDAIRHGRVMISYFRNDPFDPGGRGPRTEEILTQRDIPHLIVDQPEGFEGHFAGYSGSFYRRLAPCIVAVAGDGAMPKLSDCETHWGETPSGDVPLPDRLSFAPNLDGLAARLVGKWWGIYDVGREVILAVTNIEGTTAEAVYAVGPSPSGKDKGGYVQVVGLADGDTLEFAKERQPTLRFKMNPDGNLHAEWIAADGRSTLRTLLRKVEPAPTR